MPGGDAAATNVLSATPLGGVAEIAQMQEQGYRTEAELAMLRIISGGMQDERMLNSLRELRTSILQRLDPEKRIIMVTAAAEGGGATFVAKNLAAAIALDEGKTALLVDCNLKHPDLSQLAESKRNPGLRGFLKDTTINPEDIICRTGVARLRVIPAGDEGDEVREFFTSLRLRQLLVELKRRYPERYIVIDAPSIATDADARILVDASDQVALVVPFGKATMPQVIQSARQIGKDKFLGMIFNNKPLQNGFLR
jgi:Mrp family chromosome partitioning ATPase